MSNKTKTAVEGNTQIERDFETYKLLLNLWQSENPIKTNKLQVLLAVNGLLVSAVSLSGGFVPGLWYVYVAGAVFSLIWTFSIGRTSLFQDLWQARLLELQKRYPGDSRFSVLDNARYRSRARLLVRVFGAIPSRWYLLVSPFAFAIAWLVVLITSR
ncbi:MAG TPA: hypothetical protein VGA88_12090 [Burkholderiales bacterium]|jgi:hypothetical protein